MVSTTSNKLMNARELRHCHQYPGSRKKASEHQGELKIMEYIQRVCNPEASGVQRQNPGIRAKLNAFEKVSVATVLLFMIYHSIRLTLSDNYPEKMNTSTYCVGFSEFGFHHKNTIVFNVSPQAHQSLVVSLMLLLIQPYFKIGRVLTPWTKLKSISVFCYLKVICHFLSIISDRKSS